ncbi:uncharacterized protein LOC120679546 [Panicum virgatum]|uniref:FLZ-type domain-containing protein n=1 Tax=Panicum virgatum TaxID=38727 RepID=A0A8T0W5K3_PANVG|nr:uncharacterized protein LOC120679546 [Panicum virgatum]KAG2643612.1 hypothetical protein PVAP13_2KG459900 [Panicum virgatum]
MLPRPSQRSIFHLGEEGGYDNHHEHAKSVDAAAPRLDRERRDHGRQRRKRDAAAAADAAGGVGLQILVRQHQNHHHTPAPPPPHHSHIVLKQQVVLLPPAAARHRRGPCGSFLTACSRCRRELSANKDVYMYRGDQGFCSEECRWRQMLLDEAREHEAMVKKERLRRGGLHQPHHLHHGPRPPAAIRGAPRRLVAVAY